tara:strand:- start:64400 stop:65182 length:783 start_codon:yes stop_codon:yes gene_type:complete
MGILDRFSLENQIALITGGAGPLFGSSISEALAEAGATVIVASRNIENNKRFVTKLNSFGFKAHPEEVDIIEPQSVNTLRKRVIKRFGHIDILVNSAVVGRTGGFDEQTPESWVHSAQGNMVGLFALCKAFIPGMVTLGKGSIINISSIYGVVANDPGLYAGTEMKQPPDYTFVKGGMINFTRYLATYYGKQGIRANCICPGGYFDEQPTPFIERYENRVPLGRMLDNDDLKGAVVFLASEASKYITGTTLMVDGGWTAL